MENSKTKNLILESGKRWFLQKGFKSAALRSIVKDTGFTPGAFYGYYKTKEDLFYALTDETAQGIIDIVQSISDEMEKLPPERMLYEMLDCYIAQLPKLVDYISAHKDEVRLILKCAEGTKYENFTDAFRYRNKKRFFETIKKIDISGRKLHDNFHHTYDLLMRGYFQMLTIIVLEEDEPKKICKMMEDIALVYKNGILSLMESD